MTAGRDSPPVARWERFCDKTERAGLKCRPCAAACCHLKGPEQARYKGFGVHDSVLLCEDKSVQIVVESDIEVPFRVGRRQDVEDLMDRNMAVLSLELGRKVRKMQGEGIQISGPRFHRHYNSRRMPELGALHVHVRALAPDVMTGRRLAERLWKEIDQQRLAELVK
jgi:hypothetical protein